MEPNEVAAKIAQRRRQILVHSIIYYRFDDNIVPDHKWMQWARELQQLQTQYPELAAQGPLAKEFADWTGESGFRLPLGDPHYGAVARWLLEKETQRRIT